MQAWDHRTTFGPWEPDLLPRTLDRSVHSEAQNRCDAAPIAPDYGNVRRCPGAPQAKRGAASPRRAAPRIDVERRFIRSRFLASACRPKDQLKVAITMLEKFAESPGVTTVSRNQHWKYQVDPSVMDCPAGVSGNCNGTS